MSYTVNFISHGKAVEVTDGTILDAAAKAGIAVEGNCGGKGSCGKCKVQIKEGQKGTVEKHDEKFFNEKDLREGWVLSCKYKVENDLVVEVPHQADAFSRKTKLNSLLENIQISSLVEKVYLELPKPSIADQCADYERVLRALNLEQEKQKPANALLRMIPKTLREGRFKVTAVLNDGQLVWLEPGDTTAEKYGAVFDIGTTTVVCLLINLFDGQIAAAAAETNPQNVFGADVISRINYIIETKGAGLATLQEKVAGCLNGLLQKTLEETGVDKNRVYECTVVGNTTMSQLFAGVDPTYLAPSPFIPGYVSAQTMTGAEVGFDVNPQCQIYLLPNIAGYVGSDTVGVILGTHIHERPQYSVAIDVGTNGEIVLSGNGRILACSTAAGPAFEGAQIKHGMRAADGAIEEVFIDNEKGTVDISIIGKKRAKGICGSGILDAVAQMYESGIIDYRGSFNIGENKPEADIHPELRKRIRHTESGYELVLCPQEQSANGEDIVICQKDVRELQLGKGAIYAGIQVLMLEMGIKIEDVKEIMVAGAFGSYIRISSALLIGLFPHLPNGEILSIGNAASEGARLALVSREERTLCGDLARKTEYVELSARMDFQDEFIMALNLPAKN